MSTQLIQYIIVRSDLLKILNWPTGALIAQACHATTAINYTTVNDLQTIEYFQDINNMHKVVLEVNDEITLKNLSATLDENNILHKLWIEQPENIPTCIAIKPYPKESVHKFVKKFKLFK